jgi:hypothetical protein
MNTPRIMSNLLDEAKYLTDNDYAYGAAILARAIGHALQADGTITPAHTGARAFIAARTAAREYGTITADCIGTSHEHSARRHVTLTDAADVARDL